MSRSYKFDLKSHTRDPQHIVRGVLGLLLLINLVAAWFVFRTPGGTMEEIEADLVAKRKQLAVRQQSVAHLKQLVEQTEAARAVGDNFLTSYFLPRKHAYSILEIDLANAAKSAGIQAKERSISYEPIEGSDTLGMLNVNASFEGTYADLIELVNALDRSKRLIIIEQLQAQPQQGGNSLAIIVKLNTFFRLEGPQEAGDVQLVETGGHGAPSNGLASPGAPPPAPPKSTAEPPPAPAPKPAAAPVVTPSEPRSGPAPNAPRSRFFNRKQAPRENEP